MDVAKVNVVANEKARNDVDVDVVDGANDVVDVQRGRTLVEFEVEVFCPDRIGSRAKVVYD